jgi:dienelactone hydrolase
LAVPTAVVIVDEVHGLPVVSADVTDVVTQSGLVVVTVEQVVAKAGPASNAAMAAESIRLCLLKCDLLRLCGL